MAGHSPYKLLGQRIQIAADHLLLVPPAYAANLGLANALQLGRLCSRASADMGLLVRLDTGICERLNDLVPLAIICELGGRASVGALQQPNIVPLCLAFEIQERLVGKVPPKK